VNDAVVHGIPAEGHVLRAGDIVSVDFACSLEGYFADAAVTIPVGEVSPEARRLIAVTREALYKGIAAARAGARMGDVSAAIQRFVERAGYSVVRDLVGHGIGRAMHEDRGAELRQAEPGRSADRGHDARDRADGHEGGRGVRTLRTSGRLLRRTANCPHISSIRWR
jgi:methionyl aminopeptidase